MGDAVVHALGDGADHLDGVLARGGRRRPAGEVLAGQLLPAHREVIAHVGHRRAAQPRADVVPAEPAQGLVAARVVAVSAEVGHVDPADERDLAVDHDRLLVVAVERVLARVGLDADPGLAREGLQPGLRPPCALGERAGTGAPAQASSAHVDALGGLGQQGAEDRRRVSADELEMGGGVPAGDVHVLARPGDRLGDGGEGLLAVDQHVEPAAGPRRWIAGGPHAIVGRVERPRPAETSQPAGVLERTAASTPSPTAASELGDQRGKTGGHA